MADKQIIIDNVDVSGCSYYADGKCTNSHMIQSNCKNVAVCYYKQLKRKEQECEELKDKIKFMEEYIKTVENTRDELEIKNKRLKLDLIEAKAHGDYLNNLALSKTLDTDSEQLDQLKAENEELKKCYKNNSALLDFEETNTTKLVNKVMKLEQTLTEIRNVLDTYYDDDWKATREIEKILQKISECEVKDGNN